LAVINSDDEAGRRLLRECALTRCVSFGFGETAELRGSEIRLGREGSRLRIASADWALEVGFPLLGRFNAYNVLAATAVAVGLGIEVRRIEEALATAPQVPGRLERLELGQPFTVVVDYAHTEDALGNVLFALREITPRRLLVMFGCGGERDPGKRTPMGRIAGRLADEVVITTDNPRRESPGLIASEVAKGVESAANASWSVELDRARAIEDIIGRAQPGDTVLIAGKGHESYQEFQDTVVPFDDRVQASEALRGLGWKPHLHGAEQ
jgi:UDP-N-acetylmuramoyl-L-alanyl-D-glutamate--2,6-diaminopimelate ligase